jgi:hypothetical protein
MHSDFINCVVAGRYIPLLIGDKNDHLTSNIRVVELKAKTALHGMINRIVMITQHSDLNCAIIKPVFSYK